MSKSSKETELEEQEPGAEEQEPGDRNGGAGARSGGFPVALLGKSSLWEDSLKQDQTVFILSSFFSY